MTDKEIIIELETLIEMVNDNIDKVNQNGIAKVLRRLADKIEKENNNGSITDIRSYEEAV